jgi:hypothetical protein
MLALCAVIASCGGGSGGERVTDENQGSGDLSGDFALSVRKGEAKGVAHDAPMIGATVRAYSWEQDIGSTILGETQTDSKGDYALEIASEDAELIIQAGLDGYYLEEASGTRIDLGSNDYLTAIVGYEVGDIIDVQITPMTHLAACYADYLVEREGIGRVDARIRANSKFSGWAGVDILETKPIDVTNPDNVAVNLSDGFAYGFISAGISKTMEMVSEENGIEPHSSRYATSISWTAAACSDISHDGLLNGVNENGQMALGSYLVTADFYRSIGASILQFAQSAQNVTGLTTDDLFTMANQISISSDEVFGGIAGHPVDIDGPTISSQLAPNSLINGIVSIDFTVEDALRVQEVVFYIDDNLYATAQPNSPTLNWNTTVFTDGEHTVRVVATDVLGNESQESYAYQVVNSGAAVEITSPTLVNTLSYSVTGTFLSGVAEVSSVVVNGEAAELDQAQGTWQVDIDLEGGVNLVEAVITDSLGNTNSDSVNVDVDLFHPQITGVPLIVDFTNYDGQLNTCSNLATIFSDGLLQNRPICLNAEKVSLEGREVTLSLANEDWVVFAFDVENPNGTQGIASNADDLQVEYKVSLNNSEVINWTPIPRSDFSDEVYILPVTTEYFGDDFYQVNRDAVFNVQVRSVDEAGNETSISYSFMLDVITPQINLTRTVANEEIFSIPFANRGMINSNTFFIRYESTPSSIPYLISIDSSSNHRIEHEYESSIRENRYRVVTDEHWRTRSCTDCYLNEGRQNYSDIVQPDEHNFTDWQEVDGFNHVLSSGYNTAWQSKPGPIYGAYQPVNQDTVSAPSPSIWQDITSYNTAYCKQFSVFIDGHSTLKSLLKRVAYNVLDGSGRPAYYVRCDKDFNPQPASAYSFLQKRNTYSIEYLSGYPRNNIQVSRNTTPFNTSRIRVINNRTNTEIFPSDGWYQIPSDTTFTIVKEVTIPSIFNHNDLRVAADDSSVPYTSTIYYDKRIDWLFDSKISITRAIDSGDQNTSDVSSVTTDYEEGYIQYALSR